MRRDIHRLDGLLRSLHWKIRKHHMHKAEKLMSCNHNEIVFLRRTFTTDTKSLTVELFNLKRRRSQVVLLTQHFGRVIGI